MKQFLLFFISVSILYSANFSSPYDYKTDETIILEPVSNTSKSVEKTDQSISYESPIIKKKINPTVMEEKVEKIIEPKKNIVIFKSPYDKDYDKSLSGNTIYEEKIVLQSNELLEKIAEDKAVQEAKLKELAKDVYIDQDTLDKIESIDSQQIASKSNIVFKKEINHDVSVDLNTDKMKKNEKPKKQIDSDAAVDDFIDKKNKSTENIKKDIVKSKSEEEAQQLAPIVME